ncbi:hypothetical protein AX14_012427 [Amanita brunnescens Koide BX004]|nr:hypothetical protein AX14_012427 [Amanita brunnescens Koide BX004]
MVLVRSIATVVLSLSLLPSVSAWGFPYGSEKIRGVNLGGWLVLEPWITPSIFDNTGNSKVVDEWTFGQYSDRSTALNTLTNHWNTWITASDFEAIAAAGLNHVRLPIGYWAFDVSAGEPYIQGQLPYLEKAVTWAGNCGLKLIIDLHGVPGSQNGFDNSGHRMPSPTWQDSTSNVQRTDTIIKTLANMYKDSNVVVAIAPLNEPAGYVGGNMLSVLRQYWDDSYGNIRYPWGTSQESDTIVLLHDAFQPPSYWSGFMPPPNYEGVLMDTHIYQMFSLGGVAQSQSQHIQTACSATSTLQQYSLWPVVGEWTPAMTDCATYLNGRGVGSRYDGTYPGSTRIGSCTGLTGKASTFSSSFKTFLRQAWEAQVIAFERGGQGWLMWTWKAENADEWSYQAGLANGWIPQNPTSFKYPTICG